MSRLYYDVLIVGSGVAGLCAAIAAAAAGAKVVVVTKQAELTDCNTFHAQGGIVASAPGDSPEALIDDIIRAGDGLNYRPAVEHIVKNGTPIVGPFLAGQIGVPFCRRQDGDYDLTREGAHSHRRIMHVKDYSGAEIERCLAGYVSNQAGIDVLTSTTVIDLITNSRHSLLIEERYKPTVVSGAYCLTAGGQVIRILAGAVIIATGGVGALFTFTSNCPGAVGDGIALAERVGAVVINAEYVQFHPTVLFNRDNRRFLITEAMRGEGARLMNRRGHYFMADYSPVLRDLAPRDEVARAIYREMEIDEAGYVWLDARPIGSDRLPERFPTIFAGCLNAGIDIRREPIPVVPAAHYFCGGIRVDLNGRTNIDGLWAAGEVACTGVHGANRLASVSLLEGVVWGLAAGRDAAAHRRLLPAGYMDSIPDWRLPPQQETFDPVLIYQDLTTLKKIMWN
ncbi:MAG: FAD-dependent oxidoreductase, partial [Negativicutes bacterium]|nr:FAD-dependent oxidoreductase [Negativicutes bacterium]